MNIPSPSTVWFPILQYVSPVILPDAVKLPVEVLLVTSRLPVVILFVFVIYDVVTLSKVSPPEIIRLFAVRVPLIFPSPVTSKAHVGVLLIPIFPLVRVPLIFPSPVTSNAQVGVLFIPISVSYTHLTLPTTPYV